MSKSGNEAAMVPNGWHTITTRIVARDAYRFVEFLVDVFGASGEFQEDRPSVLWIGDSAIMVSEAELRSPMPAFLYVYVSDTDATFQRALDSGAGSIEDPFDTPYGDRRCMVEDEWGNTWQIATYKGA